MIPWKELQFSGSVIREAHFELTDFSISRRNTIMFVVGGEDGSVAKLAW
jgi:hypothetical protein